jgi:hypothetical protein
MTLNKELYKPRNLGKDGKPFDPARYIKWVEETRNSSIHFHPDMFNGKTGANAKYLKRCFCPFCFEKFNGGAQLNKHKKICEKKL